MKQIVLIFMILLAACAAPAHPQADVPNDEPVTTQWLSIRMIHSGGIMGLMRTVAISNDGNATIMDDRTKESKTLLLSTEELARVNELIASADFSTQAPRPESACADCFVYDIELDAGQGKPFHSQVTDVSMDASGMGELIAFLRNIIDKGLQK